MRTLILSALVAGSLASAGVQAQAQELKIGFVNRDRVLSESAPAKAAEAKLQAEFRAREKELNELGARLKAASEKFEKDAPTLSESERMSRQREVIERDREFQRRRRELQEDLTQRRYEEMAQVIDRANRVIKRIFDTEKYDLIVQEAVFFSARVDITPKVMEALNASPAASAAK